MNRDLIIEGSEAGKLSCPNCKSTNWVRDGSTLTFILKTYKCLQCNTHWLMFTEEATKKVKELNK